MSRGDLINSANPLLQGQFHDARIVVHTVQTRRMCNSIQRIFFARDIYYLEWIALVGRYNRRR